MSETCANTELVDINTVEVDKNLPRHERIIDFARQLKNPYHFKCGERPVRIKYSKDGHSLEECLKIAMT